MLGKRSMLLEVFKDIYISKVALTVLPEFIGSMTVVSNHNILNSYKSTHQTVKGGRI